MEKEEALSFFSSKTLKPTIENKLEKEEKVLLHKSLFSDAGGGSGGVGEESNHHYRHLLLHHLLSKQSNEQQQQQLQYQFPQIPTQHDQFPQLNPQIPVSNVAGAQIQQQPIRKRALNGPGSVGSGRRAPGRRAGAGAGEIVEVEGGHIIRSTGRKDRHSKVCTAKGPRDRRVRLSAHTAIQFYDVQDRLGYDRPSKAVDWLMNKAKSAIDELAELPPWKPTAFSNDKGKIPSPEEVDGAGDGVNYVAENKEGSSSVLMHSMDSDSIADTINSSAVQFQSYPALDLQRRDSSRSQDLKLSLQSFHDPMLIQSNRNREEEEEQQSPFGFENPNSVTAWDDSRLRQLIGWNFAGAGAGAGNSGGGGFMFIPPPQPPILFGHGVGQAATHFLTQRGTLQSNNSPLIRACINGDNSVINTNHQDNHHHNQGVSVHPLSFSGIGYASSSGGFSSFHIPARIQGDHEEEQEDDNPNKPSSVASSSRH